MHSPNLLDIIQCSDIPVKVESDYMITRAVMVRNDGTLKSLHTPVCEVALW